MGKGKPGRGPIYSTVVKRHTLSLVKRYNATQAMNILRAGPKDELAKLRNPRIVPKALSISMPTILAWAAEAAIELTQGRPKLKKAA